VAAGKLCKKEMHIAHLFCGPEWINSVASHEIAGLNWWRSHS
jgi:hypothetical protein